MSELQWIKLYVDIFTNSRKIKKIGRLKNGDTMLVIWFMLLCMAGTINDGGAIYITPEIPFDIDDLVDELKRPEAVVVKALDTFERYGMIVRDDAGYIRIASWEEYQGIDKKDLEREQTRERVARFRAKNNVTKNVTNGVTSNVTVTECNAVERESNNKNNIYNTLSNERVDTKSVISNALSDSELNSLHAQGVPDDYIEFYFKKISERGYQYDDHCAAILSWWQKDKHRWCSPPTEKEKTSSFDTDDFFETALRRSYGDRYGDIRSEGDGNDG